MTQNKINSFQDLIVWQKAMALAVRIYNLVEQNKLIRKDFSLRDQFKRAVISISDNIAEGFEYNNNADFYRFLRIAKGSCGEIRNKILFVARLEFVSVDLAKELVEEVIILATQIGCLMKKVRDKIKLTAKKTRNS